MSVVCVSVPSAVFAHGGEHPMMMTEPRYAAYLLPASAIFAGCIIGGLLFAKTRSKKDAGMLGLISALVVLIVSPMVFPQLGSTPHDMSTMAPIGMTPVGQILLGSTATVYRSPGCGCCGGYIEELKAAGAAVTETQVTDAELALLKQKHNVPNELYSCHTSIIDGYVVEGHVPFEAVAKLLKEKPTISGIALPGMPIGTPGMPGTKTKPFEIKTLSGEEFMNL